MRVMRQTKQKTIITNNVALTGILPIVVPEQAGLTSAQRQMIRETYRDGQDLPARTRYSCAIAEAVNETIKDGIQVDGITYVPNPKAKAQFGKSWKGLPYLTVGLIGDSVGTRYTLTWRGGAVPIEMAVTALKHDQGKRAPTVSIPLPLEGATVHQTGYKNGKKRIDTRKHHDTGKNGQPYPRAPRSHNRLCDDDVKKLRSNGHRRAPSKVPA